MPLTLAMLCMLYKKFMYKKVSSLTKEFTLHNFLSSGEGIVWLRPLFYLINSWCDSNLILCTWPFGDFLLIIISRAVVPDLFWQITLFGHFEIWNYPQIKDCFSPLLNKVQIQITLPKMAVYPWRVNYPSSGTTDVTYLKNSKGLKLKGVILPNKELLWNKIRTISFLQQKM